MDEPDGIEVPDGSGEVVLLGGVANAGKVVRVGGHVLRPAAANTAAIHALLRHARSRGFDGVPEPVGVDADGRERLVHIAGDVPYPPYPAWAQTDAALASTAALLRRFHEAVADFVAPAGAEWSAELADPEGGQLICHNDVCPENVVFRDGEAVAILDFEFAAPGRPEHDLAALARMCVPVDTAEQAARLGRGPFDPFRRLRLVADAYGLDDRSTFFEILARSIADGGAFVRRRVERGDQAFVEMWNQMGGESRFEGRHEWFEAHRQQFRDALF